MGGGHLIKSFYTARKRYPLNVQLKASLVTGVPDCAQIDGRAPPDAIAYFRDASNELNGIASRNGFLQLYEKTDLITAGWAKKRKSDKAEKTNGGSIQEEEKNQGGL